MPDIMLNGQLVAGHEACIPVSDRGFRFGDGVFETIRMENGKAWRWDWHMQRLAGGLAAIRIDYDTQTLAAQCARLLARNNHTHGLLRIQITRGSSGHGYLPAHGKPTCVIETLPLAPVPDAPVSLWLSTYRRISRRSLPVQSKLCQGLNSTLARLEAHEHQCFEALQLNTKGIVCEASSSNILWSIMGTLFTPALDAGVLDGTTIHAIGENTAIQPILASLKDMEKADAVCIANVAWGALPVNSLLPNALQWDSAALARKLNELLSADQQKNSKTLE
ncbi:MAG: aminotransferase class IV [Alphaproteobacteria bacterium]